MQHAAAQAASSNFALKTKTVELLPTGRQEAVALTVSELEAFRVAGVATTASKHGLEVITGASCETGAQ